MRKKNKPLKIVLTGGPGGGKTTAADLFKRELNQDVMVVPEAATILYSGGFPRNVEKDEQKATQRAIFHVQTNLEDIYASHCQHPFLLCDRGTVDGAAYWPGKRLEFFKHMNTTFKNELGRYDAVVFFETAAVGGISIEGGNPTRNESNQEAIILDQSLRKIWQEHPHFYFIAHEESFFHKISKALNILHGIIRDH